MAPTPASPATPRRTMLVVSKMNDKLTNFLKIVRAIIVPDLRDQPGEEEASLERRTTGKVVLE